MSRLYMNRYWAALGIVLLVGAASFGCGKRYPSLEGLDSERGFEAVVLPILHDQCEGCHFSGGVMYQDLPFDDRELVASRGDEVLLQLKGKGRERMAEWLALTRREANQEPGNP
jgi:hypothetical protein